MRSRTDGTVRTPAPGWLARLRQPACAARVAVGLWIIWAAIVWNVVFDRVLVLAGRAYVNAAWQAARGPGPYLRIDDWMRPAVTRGLWTASAAAGAVLLVGCVLVWIGTRGARR